ncbi:MAG: ABC transporter ATP-binding protein, partial [Rhodospirillales bacterium]|nr:ABC transporter ATP-binding protein [Rhodospirillales bacterium]
PIRFHRLTPPNQVSGIVGDLLDHVGLGRQMGRRYPHEFSGGQRQRISIARALASNPEFLVCDEPTSALDVSVQAEVLNLLQRLKRERDLTYILVSHNLAVVAHMCARLAVMNHGRIVEELSVEQLRSATPAERYTQQLLTASLGYDRAAVDRFEDFAAEA